MIKPLLFLLLLFIPLGCWGCDKDDISKQVKKGTIDAWNTPVYFSGGEEVDSINAVAQIGVMIDSFEVVTLRIQPECGDCHRKTKSSINWKLFRRQVEDVLKEMEKRGWQLK